MYPEHTTRTNIALLRNTCKIEASDEGSSVFTSYALVLFSINPQIHSSAYNKTLSHFSILICFLFFHSPVIQLPQKKLFIERSKYHKQQQRGTVALQQ